MIDSELVSRLSYALDLDTEEIQEQEAEYDTSIRPKIKLRYLSHLVATVEDLVNEKKAEVFLQRAPQDEAVLSGHLKTKRLRLYSIVLAPVPFKRKATTRHHKFGAIVFFNASFNDRDKRILIAHELGHIVNRELLLKTDSEGRANLFAFFALNDKNNFYLDEAKKHTFPGRELEIMSSIDAICPILKG
ncbi:MAG: hypothetical protein LBT00_02875 [Spirochaetaceae bacterium]|nr:hypothetical protein [Spirochaetaceae bacterium]